MIFMILKLQNSKNITTHGIKYSGLNNSCGHFHNGMHVAIDKGPIVKLSFPGLPTMPSESKETLLGCFCL